MNSALKNASFIIVDQLIDLLQQLPQDIYKAPLPVLSGNTIGKHVRHIIEFYQCIFTNPDRGIINYDARCRNNELETNHWLCIEALRHIRTCIACCEEKKLKLQMQLFNEQVVTETTLCRELIYNIEHAIHHMATIRIAVQSVNCAIQLPQHFGIAFSTIQHQFSKT